MVLAGAEPDDGVMAAVMAVPNTMVPIIMVVIIPMIASSHFEGPHVFFSILFLRPSAVTGEISTFIVTLIGLSCCAGSRFLTGLVDADRVFLPQPGDLFR